MESTIKDYSFRTFFDYLGKRTIKGINNLGTIVIFFTLAFLKIFRPKQIRELIQQVYFIGAKSANIVMLVGIFTGMVLGLQLFYTLTKFGSEGVLGSVVALTLIRELGPVLTAIMITARACSATSAEIGILRISEQIDALYTMRIDPVRYLISPRIAAAIISFPLLTAFFDLMGILGGHLTGVVLLGVDKGAYFYRIHTYVDIVRYQGRLHQVNHLCRARGNHLLLSADTSLIFLTDSYGSKSVSISTTSAVVISCVMILVSDYVVTSFLM